MNKGTHIIKAPLSAYNNTISKGLADWAFQKKLSLKYIALTISVEPTMSTIQPNVIHSHHWEPFLARKTPERTLWPPLLGIFSRVTLIDTWKFPASNTSCLHWHPSTLRYPLLFLFPWGPLLLAKIYSISPS